MQKVSTSFTSPRREFFANGLLLNPLKRTHWASPKGTKYWKRVVHPTCTPFSPCCSWECGVLIKPTYGVFRDMMCLCFFLYTCFQRVSFYCSQSYSHIHAFSHLVCQLPHLPFFLHCPQPWKKPSQPASSTVGTQFWEAFTAHSLMKPRIALTPSIRLLGWFPIQQLFPQAVLSARQSCIAAGPLGQGTWPFCWQLTGFLRL